MLTKSRVFPVHCWGTSWWTQGEMFDIITNEKTPAPPTYTEEGEEQITYENSNRSTPNTCQHTSAWKPTKAFAEAGFDPGAIPDWFASFEPGTWNRVVSHSNYLHRLPNGPWSVPRSQLLETDRSLDVAIADAAGRLNAGCRETIFALPRAVAELRDVPKTFVQAITLAGFYRNVYLAAKSGARGIREALPRDLRNASPAKVVAWFTNKSVKDVASTYLAYVFGVKPTDHDINTFLGKPMNGRKLMKLAVTQPKLYKGQKLECRFRVAPSQHLFPTLSSISLNYYQGLLRDWGNSNGIRERLSTMRGNAYHAEVHDGCVFGEVAGVPVRNDWTYGEQLAYSGGGLASTAWELISFSWLLDSVYDVGRSISQIERKGLPLEIRPTLRFGSWISHRKSISYFLPRYQVLGYAYKLVQPSDPNGYGGVVKCSGGVVPLGYQEAFHSALTYSRYPMKGLFNEVSMPTIRCPGGYMYGSLAALCVQFATEKIHIK